METKSNTAHYEVRGDIALITFDNPPVNGLGHPVRTAVVAGIEKALADPKVTAIVVTGAGKAFSGGADIKEFGGPKALAEPTLHTMIRVAETATKPVIVAIHTVCMGGGLEFSLGCHFRVASPGAQIALPEVKLGLIPGAGGTQRLPRVVGLETALNMIASGAPVASEQLGVPTKERPTALFDEIIEGDLIEGALAFARKVVAEKRPLKLVRDLKVTHPNAEAFVQFAKNSVTAVAKNFPAPLKCVEVVAASLTMPFEAGMRLERETFLALMMTPESRALRHAFFAERAASKIPDIPEDTKPRKIEKVGVIGAGTMGGGIAMNFLNAGIPVTILETKQEALDRGLATIRKNYEGTVKKGKLTADKMESRMALLKPTLSYDDLKDADLIIEAVFEEIGVKEQVFKKLDEVAKPGAILASNTSTLDVDKIASFTKRPGDVVGMHFFSPANVMKLLEVVRGKKSAPDVMATVMQVGKKIKKTAVVSGVCDGFIGNRMLKFYGRQANDLVEEGASPQQVDRAMEKFGFAMGPFRVADLAGNDIGWSIRKRLYAENANTPKQPIADKICEMGRFGQKTGAGWYRYEPGKRDAIPDPVVDKVIEEVRKANGVTPRKISDEEIVERCIYALVNEGARIVEECIAARASDVDMVYLTGYGFPLHRGGPMLYADQVGLPNVERAMKKYEKQTGDAFWKPAAILSKLAAEGKNFN
ncbi:3-hydroxyacyl-CoA dehydrogenase NAD-binding domain-containing protein [Usitatibacter palustris]|uniref:Fatty acid oxidation complex subunit alpha n=1 Tax=Usitatibacter palustris TaxID=2732487 RepID=A0A6M4H631_9PROT|nr:3-hydroxyacyl-CoA dehydrogenase NAD-binding domain-containing protein [Usitatibacter palustris]QJR13357.1 Fatty acid oxidation complex subunit alpha [Usitatibacter palustris]